MVKLIFLLVSGVEVSEYRSGERLNSTCMIKNLTLLKLNAIIFSVNVLEREKLSSIVLVNQVLLSRSKSGLFFSTQCQLLVLRSSVDLPQKQIHSTGFLLSLPAVWTGGLTRLAVADVSCTWQFLFLKILLLWRILLRSSDTWRVPMCPIVMCRGFQQNYTYI